LILSSKSSQPGQNTIDDLKQRDFRNELYEKEVKAERQKQESRGAITSSIVNPPLALTSSSSSATPTIKRVKHEGLLPLNIDADDPIVSKDDGPTNRFDDADEDGDDEPVIRDSFAGNSDNDDDDDDSDESDGDDTAELLAELNRIKQERVLDEAKREAEQKARDEQIRMESILKGNPLTSAKGEFRVKRRWDDDVVFKNCSREDVTEKEKPFINDTLRSEFHKKFMEKYIQ
jgi:protein CWC15